MAKGVSVKFKSFEETIPKLLQLIKLNEELKKHERILIKPHISINSGESTDIGFVEEVVRFCNANKSPGAAVLLAEGADGVDTNELFEDQGYKQLAEKYGISLIDLNKTQCESIGSNEFAGFDNIMYPSILKESFVISLPTLRADNKTQFTGSLANMLGAYPARYYKGFFSQNKNKLSEIPVKHQIHDIVICNMPNVALIDAHNQGIILAGQSVEMDKHAAKLLGMDWRNVGYLRMLDETLTARKLAEAAKAEKVSQDQEQR